MSFCMTMLSTGFSLVDIPAWESVEIMMKSTAGFLALLGECGYFWKIHFKRDYHGLDLGYWMFCEI